MVSSINRTTTNILFYWSTYIYNSKCSCFVSLYCWREAGFKDFNIFSHGVLRIRLDNNCEAQARVRQGRARDGERWKALKLKPLPRGYSKVGCHPPPTHPQVSNVNCLTEDRYPGRAVSVSAGVYPPLIAGWAELCLRVAMAGTAAITELSTILTHCPH